MLFDADTHVALLAIAVIGTLVLGISMRFRHTWSTVLIWVVPICLILSATDALLSMLAGFFPSLRMDGGSGDWLGFVLCFLMLVFPCEIVYQLAINGIAERFTKRHKATRLRPASKTEAHESNEDT